MRIGITTIFLVTISSVVGPSRALQAPAGSPRQPDPAGTQAAAPTKVQANPAPAPKPPTPKLPAPAIGQTKPPVTPEKPAVDPAAADQGSQPLPKSRLAPPSTVLAEIGYGDWGLSGSESKFRQHAMVPHGLLLRDLRYAPMLRSRSESAFFDVKGLGGDDYRAESRLVWGYGATQLSGSVSRFRFADPLPVPVDGSSRHVEEFSARQSLSRDFALSLQFRNDSQRNRYEVPYANLDQNTQYWDAFATGKLGSGFAAFNYSNLHYSDRTGTLLNTTVQTSGLSYLWNPSDAIGIEAAYSHVAISEAAQPESHLDIMSLQGDFALGSATDLNLRLQQRNVGTATIQSAYARDQGVGTASLFHRWKSWRAQVGIRLQNDERVNGTQSFVDVPKWSTVEGRLSGTVIAGWRLTVRSYTQTLSDPPSAITMDNASLYWNGRNYLQVKLEGGPPAVNYYLTYTYQANRNSARATDVQTTQYTVGSIWQISPTVSLFGEYHHESWSGHTDLNDFPALSNFLPNSTTGIVEMTWNQRRLFLSASYTGFSVSNDNPLLLQDGNTRGTFITLNGRYRFPRGYELGLTVAPWTYRDKVVGALNYDAAIVMVNGSARF